MEQALKNFFLFMAKNKTFNRLAKKYGLALGARRFVAGETLQDALGVFRELNDKGLMATVDHLGEFVLNEQEANEMAEHCIAALEGMAREKLDCNLSLKLTSMGLDISKELCLANMRRIMDVAQKLGIFVRIDMEDYAHLEDTLDIFKTLRQTYDNVGTVIQAYLYRSADDVEDLARLNSNLRLVKGAYKESPEVAYPDKRDVDENFKKLIRLQLENGCYAAVATHDEEIIEFTKQWVKENNIANDRFEFQMLYGIRSELQLRLVKEGYRVRVYVPYGHDWYGYFMRRLAERPANVAFVLKGMIKK
ncbi:proline dehydrogenase [Caldalkalibacillus thermarum TA2.A1]|uniref:proline dehydrogenase n=1 Tax=Caldalkalibacillus thermarum (strain TA2.A1) TaxID=986075 RepID=A0A8X8I990_CALTT|nr:proline dehydrogenase [Caldalkalibacillus thermarum]QZT33808.1 proline dehydrogenase [Caldalkalibacillus thermarum TA2.A1]